MMAIRRALLLRAVSAGLAALLTVCAAQAQAPAYPNKPVKVLVGFSAGGAADTVARIFSDGLTQALGQPFVVENRAGVAGQIAASAVAKAPPDGYTLLVTANSHTINAAIRNNPGFDAIKDFTFIRQLTAVQMGLIVRGDSPFKSVADYVAAARRQPGAVNFATSGAGTGPHITGLVFESAANVQTTHIPYKSALESIGATVAGHTVSTWGGIDGPVIQQIKSGQLKVLAVAGQKRSPHLPDVPTFEELGFKGVEGSVWFGMLAPANLPQPIVQKLDATLQSLLTRPDVLARLNTLNHLLMDTGPQAFRAEATKEVEVFTATAKKANLTVE